MPAKLAIANLVVAALGALVIFGGGCGDDSDKAATTSSVRREEPPITLRLIAEWPWRWCDVRIGMTREETSEVMGAYPTDENTARIPLIPPIELNSAGENVNEGPPEPYGVDSWSAPGSYQFNAFFDRSLHMQQLDFNGPDGDLPCAQIRIP